MLDLVDVGQRSLDSYRRIAPEPLIDELRHLAEPLRGARVLHVNATPYGGGVSELLRSEVPLLRDVGLIADWRIISGDEAFFRATKVIHNGLQGAERPLTDEEKAIYLENARYNAAAFTETYDFVFVHDPQPAAMLALRGKGSSRWVWRCHIDTSSPNPQVWEFLRPFLTGYDAGIFTLPDFVPPDLPIGNVEIIPPAIDPQSPKNLPLPEGTARQVLQWIGVRPDRPLITQVSRFDHWKDPFGVIAVYRQLRREFRQLQLALIGSFALDDPEGWELYRRLHQETREDPQLHVFTNVVGVGNVEVNAFQSLSNVVIQKSIREGFGLVVSESLWKGTPVVAGRTGGIPLQMADGAGGVLIDTIEQCVEAVAELLRNPDQARALGARGRERVREHFLIPRLVLNHLALMRELLVGQPLVRGSHWPTELDPVCGMALRTPPPLSETVGYTRYGFCSERCRAIFLEDPERYTRVHAPAAEAPH